MSTKLDQSLINHVGLVLDASVSMSSLSKTVVQVADGLVQELSRLSTEMDQETRITVYTFGDTTECIYYDKDVLRLPSLKDKYRINGNTALIDATMQSIEDLEKSATLYGDHAFLVYDLTDGEENHSRKFGASALQAKLAALPDNWTVAALVPNVRSENYARRFGFHAGNIAIWSTNGAGLAKAGQKIQSATQAFMQNRALGVRGTKSIFQVNTKLNDITKLKAADPGTYEIIPVTNVEEIRDFVTTRSAIRQGNYRKGCAFYQLTKSEEVQPSKQVAVLDMKTQQVYIGDDARQFVGLPLGQYVQAVPENHADRMIFIQSTSVNRKLVPNTMVLVV